MLNLPTFWLRTIITKLLILDLQPKLMFREGKKWLTFVELHSTWHLNFWKINHILPNQIFGVWDLWCMRWSLDTLHGLAGVWNNTWMESSIVLLSFHTMEKLEYILKISLNVVWWWMKMKEWVGIRSLIILLSNTETQVRKFLTWKSIATSNKF